MTSPGPIPSGRVLVTGGAGFIGSHLVDSLLLAGMEVAVLDNLDPYYDVAIKRGRLARLQRAGGDRLRVLEGDIRDPASCEQAVAGASLVVHLAALAGVRPSIADPARYMDVNVVGTQRLLDAIAAEARGDGRRIPVVFGSSSSVYGGNEKVPFAETDPVDQPVSPYAASKKAGEVVCHSWHHLTGHPVSCLRFFTVYGPDQRPEMAIHKFSARILRGQSVPMFGDGSTSRDYTFVTDIVAGIRAAMDRMEGFAVFNLGGNEPVSLADLIRRIGRAAECEPRVEQLPMQPGDVIRTWADLSRVQRELGYAPKVGLDEGLKRFIDWLKSSGRTRTHAPREREQES